MRETYNAENWLCAGSIVLFLFLRAMSQAAALIRIFDYRKCPGKCMLCGERGNLCSGLLSGVFTCVKLQIDSLAMGLERR